MSWAVRIRNSTIIKAIRLYIGSGSLVLSDSTERIDFPTSYSLLLLLHYARTSLYICL